MERGRERNIFAVLRLRERPRGIGRPVCGYVRAERPGRSGAPESAGASGIAAAAAAAEAEEAGGAEPPRLSLGRARAGARKSGTPGSRASEIRDDAAPGPVARRSPSLVITGRPEYSRRP